MAEGVFRTGEDHGPGPEDCQGLPQTWASCVSSCAVF